MEMISRHQSSKPVEAITIVHVEENATVECYSCDVSYLQWTYKSENGVHEEIIKRNKTIRNKNHGKRARWFDLLNDSNCTYSLFMPQIQFEAAGVYSCWDNTAQLSIRNIIVLSEETVHVNINNFKKTNLFIIIFKMNRFR